MRTDLKPLDLVKTPKGAIAMVTEVADDNSVMLSFLMYTETTKEKNGWWESWELTLLDSLPRLLSEATAHPMGNNGKKVSRFFD